MRQCKFVGTLIVAALWLMSAQAWSQEHAGSLESASGKVSVTRDNQTRPAQVGMQLKPGDRVSTSANSHAEIRLLDETVLVLGPDGRMRISRFRFDPDTNVGSMLLTLIKGALRVTTGLIGQRTPEAVQIRTIVGTVGIRGTQFIVEARESD